MNKKAYAVLSAAILSFGLFCGCGDTTDNKKDIAMGNETEYAAHDGQNGEEAKDASVWYPYWDNDTADEELAAIGDDLGTICFFAAYFDEHSKMFIPDNITDKIEQFDKSGYLKGKTTFLTIVNDKLLDEGSSLKDTELLYEILGSSNLAEKHADNVIKLAKKSGLGGVEIDYEAIKKDTELWGHFNEFIKVLSEKASKEGLLLRVIFEPSAPIDSFEWPEYPEYVMMCYNLKGYGTEPGPKADVTFIKDMYEKMTVLKGKTNLAFATGGFDFAEDGSVKQINYANAVSICEEYNGEIVRDPESGAVHFEYTDDIGEKHEVWYADQETLKVWISTAKEAGCEKFSIWRLGGNL
jgi:spore germination protein YaaH